MVNGRSQNVAVLVENNKHRAVTCLRMIRGKEQACNECRKIMKVIARRGQRAWEADARGTIRGRPAAYTNTDSLRNSKVMALQVALHISSKKIKELRVQIDKFFSDTEKDIHLDLKKRMFLKLSSALATTEKVPWIFKLFEAELNNLLVPSKFRHRHDDEMKVFWKTFRHISGPSAIDFLRGADLVDPETGEKTTGFNFRSIPCNSTLDQIEDTGSYGFPSKERLIDVREILLNQATTCQHYIISFDGSKSYKNNGSLAFVSIK